MTGQDRSPLFEALQRHVDENVVPFHVPAHKHGQGLQEMRDYLGERTLALDVNSMDDVDDLSNPISVIDEAQRLCAEAFNAAHAYFLINGTTSGIHAMMISSLRPGDRIILPRNCHKSAFSGLILSGAVPVYAKVEINPDLGIATNPTVQSFARAFERAPQATAVFLLNPNYYGLTGDLRGVMQLAREWEARVLVDEAHGGHMYFHDDFPFTAMDVGADMSCVSTHKTCGSLTQSSILLQKTSSVERARILNTLSMLRTTSASYLLMASIDVARRQLATRGKDLMSEVLHLARHARDEINKIDGLHAFGPELVDNQDIHAFDETKLCVHVRKLGMTGFEMERRLRQEYRVQVELSDMNNILAMITIGDTQEQVAHLVNALKSIAGKCRIQDFHRVTLMPDMPETIVIPRDAFHSHKKSVPLHRAANEISGEMVMAYPPGIPVVCPGERLTHDIIDYITILKEHNCRLQGTADPMVNEIRVLGL
ncbi:MAG: aminotransferase class I/II-fold pyridoxal phosphate-dependent enzyme [Spirochaetales bacterium]|nr:aminotransferase class I/II-fold pyridoxal phosphate-dependent enzyme [Leptospiraceae bacterium]MCP5480256.1 aminotransferase class I/II-fold pyridoxal phosphate-dependent enzyme [Spirochaetales bacterium]MCP5486845.1 aminotransferase class I/II-fold pyridoxal phosphate-dependent enzyme [Spirochaetales bacterium]